jgi:hypothetical protein
MLLGQNGGVDWDCNPFPPRIFFFRNDPFALTFALEVIEGESWRAEEKAAIVPQGVVMTRIGTGKTYR